MSANGRLIRHLVDDARKGSISLVLGAGVSMSAGVPSWGSLVEAAWSHTRARGRRPAWIGTPLPSTKRALGSIRSTPEYQIALREGLDVLAPLPHPLAFQIALEEIESSLRPTAKSDTDPVGTARAKLAEILRAELYLHLRTERADSLAAIVETLRTDQRRPVRRIARVISFNADDLVESAANVGHSLRRDPVVWPISRASYHPRRGRCANGLAPIPIYHVHGYLPRPENSSRDAPDTLVFTDREYWESVANPTSFANRVVANALHDSHCVFVGLSMRDVNLMRWLGIHTAEVQADKISEYLSKGKSARAAERAAGRALRRHYWIRTDADDADGFVGRHLYRRGVFSIGIADWGDDFRTILDECFVREGSAGNGAAGTAAGDADDAFNDDEE